jgi:hypothetical protein
MYRISITVFVAFAVAVCGGCQPSVQQGEISGRITLNGEPVSQGYVIFRNHKQGVHMMAEIGKDGTYRASTADGYGLPHGDYEVSLSPPLLEVPFGPADAPPDPGEVAEFPKKLLKAKTSGLVVTISDGPRVLDVELSDFEEPDTE